MPKLSKYKKNAIIVMIIGSISVLLYFSLFNKKRLFLNENQIKTTPVISGLFYDLITVTGKVVPIRTVYLNAYEGGRIKEVYTQEGSTVKKNDTLMLLENQDLQLRILNSEAAITEQTTRMRDTRLSMEKQAASIKSEIIDLKYKILQQKRIFDTNKQLFEKQFVSKQEVLTSEELFNQYQEKFALLKKQQFNDSINRQLQLEQLDESIKIMRLNLQIIRQKLESLIIKSPINGIVSSISGEVGETKPQGSQLGVLTVQTALKIRLTLDEKFIGAITPGLSAILLQKNKHYDLTIGKVTSEISNKQFEVECRFGDITPPKMHLGSTVTVGLELATPQLVTIIPRGDFMQHTDGDWLFVVNTKKHKAQKRFIKIKRQNNEFIEVIEGLTPNEQVLVNGYETMSEFDEIILK